MKKHLFSWILLTLFAGIMTGLSLGKTLIGSHELAWYIAPFGNIFVMLLQMVVTPIILFSLMTAAANMSPSHLGRIGLKMMALYLGTGLFAALIALLFANYVPLEGNFLTPKIEGFSTPAFNESASFNLLTGIIPLNPFMAFSSGNILQIIFFAVLSGISLAFLRNSEHSDIRQKAETVFNFCSGISEIMYLMVRWIMYYAPVGVFALMTDVFTKNGWDIISPLAGFVGLVYLAFFAQLVIVYGLLLKYAGWTLPGFLKQIRAPIMTAMVTRSSSAALPVSLNAAENNLKIPRSISSFTLPVGATLNMDGVTIQQCISVLFIAGAVGLPLDLSQQATVLFVAVVASIGTAGIPSGSAIMLLAVLNSVGLVPSEGSAVAALYAMLLGIDAVMDMGQTALNVTGDLVCTSVIAKTENKNTEKN